MQLRKRAIAEHTIGRLPANENRPPRGKYLTPEGYTTNNRPLRRSERLLDHVVGGVAICLFGVCLLPLALSVLIRRRLD